MNEKERLQRLMELRGFRKKKDFAAYLGIKENTLSNWFARGTFDMNLIESKFPDVNKSWLYTGDGQVVNEKDAEVYTPHTVPLLPIYVKGGSLQDFSASVMEHDCERLISPVKDAEMAITVSGDSMTPEFPSGSYVFLKKINSRAFIEWGRTYVLDTVNGAIIKKVLPGPSEDCIICSSVNPEYKDFQVYLQDVFGMYRVLLMMALK